MKKTQMPGKPRSGKAPQVLATLQESPGEWFDVTDEYPTAGHAITGLVYAYLRQNNILTLRQRDGVVYARWNEQ